jgi:DNA-binding transcriptional ArsR family regulator
MTDIIPLEALGDPTRRKLFERLRDGPCSVNQLVMSVSVSQPAVSQHLRILRQARLVQVEKCGQRRVYRVDPQGLAELRAYIDSFWDQVLGAFQRAANQSAREETQHEE